MSPHRRLWMLLCLLLAALPGCAPKGSLFLYVEGQRAGQALRIPDDVDALALQVTSPDGKTVVFDKAWELTKEQFPLSLGLEPGDQTPDQIRVVATLSKAGTPVAGAEAVASLVRKEVTTITLRVTAE